MLSQKGTADLFEHMDSLVRSKQESLGGKMSLRSLAERLDEMKRRWSPWSDKDNSRCTAHLATIMKELDSPNPSSGVSSGFDKYMIGVIGFVQAAHDSIREEVLVLVKGYVQLLQSLDPTPSELPWGPVKSRLDSIRACISMLDALLFGGNFKITFGKLGDGSTKIKFQKYMRSCDLLVDVAENLTSFMVERCKGDADTAGCEVFIELFGKVDCSMAALQESDQAVKDVVVQFQKACCIQNRVRPMVGKNQQAFTKVLSDVVRFAVEEDFENLEKLRTPFENAYFECMRIHTWAEDSEKYKESIELGKLIADVALNAKPLCLLRDDEQVEPSPSLKLVIEARDGIMKKPDKTPGVLVFHVGEDRGEG